MIDLHCHILPGIDDGAPDLETSLEMARIAVADGIRVTACTPHITPGIYDNVGPDIRGRIAALQGEFDRAGIALKLTSGADVHLAPDLTGGIRSGRVLTVADSRYFLFEPPHHIAPPRIEDTVFELMTAGYMPVVTHPERLSWIESHYEIFKRMVHAGAWMQLTCGSITGRFGDRPKYWSERMLEEGLVHIIATDAHNLRNRKPAMASARDAVAERLGEQAAIDMVLTRPQGILDNVEPSSLPPLVGGLKPAPRKGGLFSRLFQAA
ncbi:MAG: Capsular biosynthesis protein [Caulobacteraceae bacterium]|nr:Capsular biosynthesis protein [Caulobacteraceae bacterium]